MNETKRLTCKTIEGTSSKNTFEPDSDLPDDPSLKYHASKVLAHRATIDWVAKHTPHFKVITLHPSFVFGRNLAQTSADAIDGTNAMLMTCLESEVPIIPIVAVDVRDVGAAHIKALQADFGNENDKVHEFILTAGENEGWTWDNVVRFVREKFPHFEVKLKEGLPNAARGNANKAKTVLGIEWRRMEDTMEEFLRQQLELRAQA